MKRLRLTRARIVVLAACVVAVAGGVPAALALLGGDDSTEHRGHTGAAVSAHPVAGHFKPDETELADCESGDQRCLEQAFGNLAYHEGPETAIERFDAAMQADRAVESNCHRIAHTLGSASLARFDGNVSEAFARGTATCWSGYYHGILERSFTGVPRDEVGGVARTICADEDIKRTTFILYQCVHGLGHGLMIYSGYDLPWSLSTCDQLATEWDQTSCTGGIFMENISSTYDVRSEWVRDDDPVYPCQAVEERHKLYCYLMVTSRINELNGFDWAKTAETCRGVEGGWVETCFESYGRDASGFTRQSPTEVARLCAFARAYAASCVYGAARDMTSNYANGRRASQLCRLVAARLRTECFTGVGTILGNLHATDEAKRAACADVTPQRYLASCVSGTGARVGGVVQSSAGS
jgi:hypothetical protein